MTYEAKKVPTPMTPERAGGTRESAIEWIQHAVEKGLDYGDCLDWLGDAGQVDEALYLDVDSWVEELVAQLPCYVEVVELLKADDPQAPSRAAEIAKELK